MVDPQTFVLIGTRGGPKRSRILDVLEGEPHTLEELATDLGISPRALREHLDVLEANEMVDARESPDDTEFVLTAEAPAIPE